MVGSSFRESADLTHFALPVTEAGRVWVAERVSGHVAEIREDLMHLGSIEPIRSSRPCARPDTSEFADWLKQLHDAHGVRLLHLK
jgi:hypothetical protein